MSLISVVRSFPGPSITHTDPFSHPHFLVPSFNTWAHVSSPFSLKVSPCHDDILSPYLECIIRVPILPPIICHWDFIYKNNSNRYQPDNIWLIWLHTPTSCRCPRTLWLTGQKLVKGTFECLLIITASPTTLPSSPSSCRIGTSEKNITRTSVLIMVLFECLSTSFSFRTKTLKFE